MKPIHKKGSTNKESNYRGISLSSCLAKFFNNLVFKRLTRCFENLNLLHPHLMGFRPRMKTSNNCLVLKRLIDKQFKENEELYSCFIDFSEAFDTVWTKGLLAKIESYGINGKILNLLRSLCSNTTAHVKLGDAISDSFEIMLGVKQGDPQAQELLNILDKYSADWKMKVNIEKKTKLSRSINKDGY